MIQISLIPVLMVMGIYGIVHLFVYLIELYDYKYEPFVQIQTKVLRGPGQSLLKQIHHVNADLKRRFTILLFLPVMTALAYLSYSKMMNGQETVVNIAIIIIGSLLLLVYSLVNLLLLRSKRRLLRIEYDGEVSVACELNQLVTLGYHVYHDFPTDEFNIDHVLVGPDGVMTINTKTRSNGLKKFGAVVSYDGRMLHFPKHSDHQSIDQAKRHAAWFSEWLLSTIGEEICARAIVALPGWRVKRTSAEGIPVVNPEQFESLFKHIKPRPIPKTMIERIVKQIELQCSTAESQGNHCYLLSQEP